MGNCLKTQLKENVQNNKLGTLGYCNILVIKDENVTGSLHLEIISKSEIIIKSTGGPHLSTTNGGAKVDTITISGTSSQTRTTVYYDNDDYIIMISNKYDKPIRYIWLNGNVKYDISEIALAAAEHPYSSILNLKDSKVFGDIIWFKEYTRLEQLYISNTKVTGDIINFAKSRIISNLIASDSLLYGSIESLANGLVANNKSSGTLSISCNNTRITYNNSYISTCTLNFGTSMVNPTAEDTARGWQIA